MRSEAILAEIVAAGVHLTTTNTARLTSPSSESPLSRLIADLQKRPAQHNFAGATPTDTSKHRGRLEDLRRRLAAADEVYPGIHSAIDRGVLEELEAAFLQIGSGLLYERERAGDAEALAADRLEGARELHAQTQAANSRSQRLSGADLQNVALTATVWELEATIKRISRNANRLIAGARDRAAQADKAF